MAQYSVEFYAKSLARKTRIDLVIPSLNLNECLKNQEEKYYQNQQRKYPLLLCLHGFGENEKSWQMNSDIVGLALKYKFAVCFVNGENKWFLNLGQIEDFYSLIERDLLDFLYGNFTCLSSSEPLAICGVSMGGYGALYHYLKNTQKYLCAIALSPATRPDSFKEKEYELRNLFLESKEKRLNVYLSIGEKDFIFDISYTLNEFFKENKIPVTYKFIPNADHSWETWKKEVFQMIDYLKKQGFLIEN